MEECLKGSQRQVYELPRLPEEIRINNYNPLMLMLWKANMDIQFIAESTLAIAQYVTGYVTKAEKSNRKRRLRDNSKRVEIQQQDPNSTNIFEDNLVDTFYPKRPDDMEDVCLHDFVANYVKCGVDKDGKT